MFTNNRGSRALSILMLATFTAAWLIFASIHPAGAAQPYGGCDEAWQAPHSAGAQECRDHGWTVRPRLVVSPHSILRYSALPPCTFEDASGGPIPCSWNFPGSDDGMGGGASFWVSGTYAHNRGHYVWLESPLRGHPHREWVGSNLDKQMDSTVGARDWRECWVRFGGTAISLGCPNGVTVRF